MTTWLTTRHAGAVEWAIRQGFHVTPLKHLDPGRIEPGDVVIGTLPAHLAAEVCRRGGRYLHLALDLPPDMRGHELSADDMEKYGARLEEFRIERVARSKKDGRR